MDGNRQYGFEDDPRPAPSLHRFVQFTLYYRGFQREWKWVWVGIGIEILITLALTWGQMLALAHLPRECMRKNA